MSSRRRISTAFPSRGRAVALCLALGVVGWFTGFAATMGVELYLVVVGYESRTLTQLASSVAFNVVGGGGLALTYLIARRNGFDREFVLEFLRLRRPTLQDVAWVVFGLVGAFLVALGYQQLVELIDPFGTGGEGTTHSGIEEGRERPMLLLVGIPIAILLTGPAEELLYRGIIQSRLGESFPSPIAVLLAALVFGVVHVPVYVGDDVGAVLVSLGTVTALGLYFGTLYELSKSLLVPAIIHGLFNATVYVFNFLEYV